MTDPTKEGVAMKPLLVAYACFVGLEKAMKERFGELAQVWYTERNGDGIVCVMPENATEEDLPKTACNYWIIEWIHPDKEFGTGVFVNKIEGSL